MKKWFTILFAVLFLTACGGDEEIVSEEVPKGETKESVTKEESQEKAFNPEEFLKEAEEHSLEWYIAETEKLTPEEITALEDYQAELDAKELEAYKSMIENAETKESVNEEGQNVIEYKMVNTLGHDVEFFQLQWVEGSDENVSQTVDNVKDGQEFTLIVDPAFDKTLDDIDLSTVILTGS